MTESQADTRQPNPIDVYVGERIRMRRKFLGLSQEALANSLGLTFQQVQKYERGSNRISASKLYQTARTLQAPISYFFEGVDAEVHAETSVGEASVHSFLATGEGIELAASFPRIESSRHRRRVLDLVKTLADE
ncbi:helix-turn-helix domain-containing protein [Asticcacaulis sp. YBE204]|uniref:helix-turn-helix domain-containing protein n=1 Tax=Asticcacaulis sp. YBE204 TaxID=1282363 RepID=UPI0004CF4579|nr:helix-turn-helix transcriptional regulator [Asticcacaulis sp. YBE204]